MPSMIFKKSLDVMPGGVSSPVRAFQNLGCDPLIIDRAEGSKLTSISGVSYLDFCMSWGALLHGHANPTIASCVVASLHKGSSFGLTTPVEVLLADRLTSLLPLVDKVRFVSSGTEACMSAVRLARGYTKRSYIIKFDGHYHGHADAFLINAGSSVFQEKGKASSPGVPLSAVSDTISLPFNDSLALERVFKDPDIAPNLAAVILEIVPANMGVVLPKPSFLKKLEVLARANGTLIIADEVITGFRLHLGGAYQIFDLKPDIICLGKIIGGGFPCAAFGGRHEIMDCLSPVGKVFQAGTLSGNPVALSAGMSAIEMASDAGFYTMISSKVNDIVGALKKVIDEKHLPIQVQSIGGMFTLFFGLKAPANHFKEVKTCDFSLFKAYFRHMLAHHIYIPPSPYEALFVSSKHSDSDLKAFIDASVGFFDKMPLK